MNRQSKIVICILLVFIVGMVVGVAFAESAEAKKYNDKKSITVKVIDGEKTVKVKCKYDNGLRQYIGHKDKNGKKYSVIVCYEEHDGMQGGKMGWWTSATDAGMTDGARTGSEYNMTHPVTTVEIS